MKRKYTFIVFLIILPFCSRISCNELHDAARKGNLKKLKTLLASKKFDVNEKEKTKAGTTALIISIFSGKARTAKLLLDYGADVNVSDNFWFTPLMTAIQNSDYATVKLLLAKGANVKAVDECCGRTPLLIAAQHGYINIIKLLIVKGSSIYETYRAGSTALTLQISMGKHP